VDSTVWVGSTRRQRDNLAAVRVLVFHGYLLRGTGSNVYNASLVAALVRLGHEVDLLCQERHAEELEFVAAVGDWDAGELVVRRVRDVGATVYRPDIGGLLPVYVADRYEDIEARPFPELSDAEVDRYVRANIDAVSAVLARSRPDVALANHLIMGPAILARALSQTGVPYAVTVHGSALEYTVKPHPRFLPYAREGIAAAAGVLVGSRHTAESLWAALGDPTLPARTRLGPPGVDIVTFRPRERADALARLGTLADRLAGGPSPPAPSQPSGPSPPAPSQPSGASPPAPSQPSGASPPAPSQPGGAIPGEAEESAFARDQAAAAAALAELAAAPPADRLVAFVGKLIVSKGIDLLLVAWPLVLADVPEARLVVIGFGAYSETVMRLVDVLSAEDLDGVREIAAAGRAAEGGPRSTLHFVVSFLDWLEQAPGARERYLAAAALMRERVLFTGRLEHDEVADALPPCEAMVVPSTFPESFGMVAAEAAACGALPVSAAHSGLAEVSSVLARDLPASVREFLSFPLDRHTVRSIAACVGGWLLSPADARDAVRASLVATVAAHYSWEGVARGVIAAARGDLDALDAPQALDAPDAPDAPEAPNACNAPDPLRS
jgi:glycosyltransferase involved in cell wall biosynthesis